MLPLPAAVKAIFFDLDDTLCDYMNAAVSSRREAFELIRAKLADHTIDHIDEHYKKAFAKMLSESMHGGSWRDSYMREGALTRNETMRWLCEALGLCELDDQIHLEVSEKYHQLRRSRLKFYEDTMPSLFALNERYTLGVITNGPADIQRDELQTLKLDVFFTHVFIEGAFGWGKPDPRIFLAACRSAEVNPQNALYVGNSLEHDVEGALRAGMGAIWINRDNIVRPESAPKPDLEIKTLYELLDWLGVQRPFASASASAPPV